jgi:hypothetical protein
MAAIAPHLIMSSKVPKNSFKLNIRVSRLRYFRNLAIKKYLNSNWASPLSPCPIHAIKKHHKLCV